MSSIILILKSFNLISETLNLGCSVIRHSLHAGIFSHKIFNFKIGLLQLYFQCFNLFLEVNDAVLIDIWLNPLLFLWSLFLVKQEWVFFFKGHNQIVKAKEVSLKLSQFIDIVFKMTDQDVLLVVFGLSCVVGFHSGISVVQIFAEHV